MKAKTLLIAALGLLTAASLGSCVKDGTVDRGDINAAIALTISDITTSGATVTVSSAQENLAKCWFVEPVEADVAKFYDMDAIDRKAYILENGKEITLPYEFQASGLALGTQYAVAAIGADKEGVFRAAPVYKSFETHDAEISVSVACVDETAGAVKYQYSVTLGEYTKKANYVLINGEGVDEMTDDAVLAKIHEAGADVKTTAISITDGEIVLPAKVSVIVAAVAIDDLGREGEFDREDVVVLTSKKVKCGTDLAEKSAGVYEGVIELPAQQLFVIVKDDVKYGFTPYSGNGGVGTVNCLYSAMPYYSLAEDPELTYQFKVSKAIGQLKPQSDGGIELWTNTEAAEKVLIRADFSNADGTPRYYLEIQKEEDPNLIFYEGFDLSVFGGQLQAPVKGTAAPAGDMNTWDGTEPGASAGTISTTTVGIDSFIYPSTAPLSPIGASSSKYLTETFMKNWGLEEWTFAGRSHLGPGYFRTQASSENNLSYVITPKFSKLSAASTVEVTITCFNFAATLDGSFEIVVLGAGNYTKAVCTNDKGFSKSYDVAASGALTQTSFVPEAEMLPKDSNGTKNKAIATMVLTIEGATADTQLRFGKEEALPKTNAQNGRVCIDDITVMKK